MLWNAGFGLCHGLCSCDHIHETESVRSVRCHEGEKGLWGASEECGGVGAVRVQAIRMHCLYLCSYQRKQDALFKERRRNKFGGGEVGEQ